MGKWNPEDLEVVDLAAVDKKNAENAALVINKHVPELTPEAWFDKLSADEREKMKKRILPKYNNFVSARNRELIRNEEIILKNGVPYIKEWGWSVSMHMRVELEPRKLTPKEIEAELKKQMDNDRTELMVRKHGMIPWWEAARLSKKDWKEKQAQLAAEEAARRTKLRTREQWAKIASTHHGRKATDKEVELYMLTHEDPRDRFLREEDEMMKISSFRDTPWYLYDHQIHKFMRWGLYTYILYTYQMTAVYTVLGLWVLWHIVHGIILLRRFKRAAGKPFVYDTKSKWSEQKQRDRWEFDRWFFGYTKERPKGKGFWW